MRTKLFTAAGVTFAGAVILLTSLVGCGGGGSGTSTQPPPAITSVTVSCTTATVPVVGTDQCNAKVQGTGNFNPSVTWSVSGVQGGNSTLGTISSSGFYSAPSMVPSPANVTITATSQEDPTHAGNASVSVKLSIALAPQIQSLQTFHSVAFSATVMGVSNTAVTWTVNQIAGGNSAIGQIDSTGLYTAPNALSPSTVTIGATSVADPTQSATAEFAVVLSEAPVVLSTTPANGDDGIALDASIQALVSEPLDPSTVNSTTVILSSPSGNTTCYLSYDPLSEAIILSPQGSLLPQTTYTVNIAQAVGDPSGTGLGADYQWSFTTEPPSAVTGNVSSPAGVDPTTLAVISYAGQQTTPDASGNFAATLSPVGTNAVVAMAPGQSFGMLAFSLIQSQNSVRAASAAIKRALDRRGKSARTPSVHVTRYQITASPRVEDDSEGVVVDFQTTAESLVFLNPYLTTTDPSRSAGIMAAIAADSSTTVLAQALEAAWNESDPLSDPAVLSALQTAIGSVLNTLTESGSAMHSRRRSQMGASRNKRPLLQEDGGGSAAPVVTPPRCQGGSSNGLQCLDLDYFTVSTTTAPTNNLYSITLDNQSCSVNHPWLDNLGCAVDWVVLAGPVTTSPEGGVFAVFPGSGSSGPDSPLSSAVGSNCSLLNCTAILYLPGQSTFDDLNVVDVMGEWLANTLTSSLGSAPNIFTISNQPGDYIVRAYSGSAPTDSVEFNNQLNGNYDQGLALGGAALVGNTIRGTLKVAEAAKIIDPNSDKCILEGIADGASATEDVYTILTGKLNSQTGLVFTFDTIVGDILGQVSKAVDSCTGGNAPTGEKTSSRKVKVHPLNRKGSGLGSDGLAWPPALNFIAAATTVTLAVAENAIEELDFAASVGNLGDTAQRVAEMVAAATPVETAIIHVPSATESPTAPTITGISPNPMPGVDGKQTVQIIGTGFVTGATLNWQDLTGGGSGTNTPISWNSTTITASMNFTNQTAKWEIQVVNPNNPTAPSNWFQFSVQASGSPLADLAPENVTLSNNSVVAGATVTVSLTMANLGAATAGTSTTRLRLNQSATGTTTSDVVLGDISTPSIAAGSSAPLSMTVTIPNGISSGTYYVWAVADNFSQVQQSNTNNDYAHSSALTVAASAGAPSVSSVSPNPVPGSNSAQTLTINGANFVSGATLTYYDPVNGKTYSNRPTNFINAGQLTDTAFINGGDAGSWTVTVVNPGGGSSAPFTFTVSASAPSVSSVSPNPVPGSNSAQTLTINGANFVSGATLTYYDPVNGKTYSNRPTNFINAGQLTDTAFINGGDAGSWTVTVVNPGGGSSAPFTFTVSASAPSVSSVSPNPVPGSNSAQTLTINGANFVSGATLTYYDPVNGKTYSNRPTNFINAGQLTDTAFINGGDAGSWTVTVVNPGGGSSAPFTFTVSASAPSVSSVSPNPVPGSNSAQTLTINGANFVSGATLTYYDPVNGKTYSNRPTNFINAGQLTDTAFINGGDAGSWTVTVVNPGGGSSAPFTFTVSASAPSVSSVSPNPVPGSNSAQTLTINGANFVSGATLTYYDPVNGKTYSNRPTNFINAGQLTDTAFINGGDAGSWTVTVVNPGGGSSAPFTFTVSASAPSVSSVSPNPVPGSNSAQTLTINGANFVSGATLTYYDPVNGKTYSNRPTNFINAGQLTDTAFINGGDAGSWTVTVVNPGGGSSAPFTFTVSASAPSVSSVSPNPVPGSNSAQTLTINGANFVSGATLTYYDPVNGKTYSNRPTNFINAGQLTDTAFINGGDAGSWTVTVVNPGGGSSAPFTFTVSASAPSVSSVSPNPVPGSNSAQTLTINGANFVSGATLTYYDPVNGKTYSNRPTNFINAGQLTDTAFINGGDAGSWTVTVVNPGGGSSAPFTFTVSASAPSVSSVSPNPVPGSNSAQTLTINGANFVSGATLTYYDPVNGKTYSNRPTNFINAGQLTDTAFINGGDAGSWTVTVVNPGGGSSAPFTFTVQ